MSYLRWSLQNVLSDDEPLISETCLRYGAEGISENLIFEQSDLIYEPHVVDLGETSLEVYFLNPPREGLEQELRARWPEVSIRQHLEQDRDWLAEWKKGYTAFPLVGNYWVVPSWETSPVAECHTLAIDPGMAFGTGTHETTQLAAQLLIEQVQLSGRQSLLDVGTGTGILALLACKEGVREIMGTEIDVEARRVARENLQLNHCARVQVLDEQVDTLAGTVEVVVANIIDGVLLQLKADLLRLLAPQGKLVLSGILAERATYFLQQFLTGTHLRVQASAQNGEWVSYVLEAKS